MFLTMLLAFGSVAQAKVRRVGDLNADGKLDAKDVKMMAEYIIGTRPLPADIRAVDINEDGKVTVGDVCMLVKNLRNPENLPVIVLPDTEAQDKDEATFD